MTETVKETAGQLVCTVSCSVACTGLRRGRGEMALQGHNHRPGGLGGCSP